MIGRTMRTPAIPSPTTPNRPHGRGRHPGALVPRDDAHLPPDIRRQLHTGLLRREWFAYPLRTTTAIGTSEPPINLELTLDTDSHFELCQLTTDSANFNLQIRDGGADGQTLGSDRIALSAIAGSGTTPFWLPVPRFFRARTTIVVAAISTSGSQQFQLYFIGNKLLPSRERGA